MFRRTALTVGLAASCLWGLILVAGAANAEDNQAVASKGYKIVAPVEALMDAQAQHFDQLKELILDDEAEDRFRRIRTEAFILAELCNINAYRAEKDDYRGWAEQARDSSLKMVEGAAKKDIGAVKKLTREIQDSCKACHNIYK